MDRMSTLPACSFTVPLEPAVEPGAASFQMRSVPNTHRPQSWEGTPPEPPKVCTATYPHGPAVLKSCWIMTSSPHLLNQRSKAAQPLVPLLCGMLSANDEVRLLKLDSGFSPYPAPAFG